jgi:feruloyl esterase
MEDAGGWAGWILSPSPTNDRPPASIMLGNRFFRNFVYDDPRWDVARFDISKDPFVAENKIILGHTLASLVNTNETDLSELKEAGAKLIEYVGWGDPVSFSADVTEYHRQVVENAGGLEKTGRFYRLFMVPGMLHCADGPGANAFGQPFAPALENDSEHHIMRALEAWVEQGIAPRKVVAAKFVDDKPEKGVAFTRPLCPFPQFPRYKGSGSTDLAVNFECASDPPNE